MKQQNIFDPVPSDRFQILSKEELIELAKQHQNIIGKFQKHIEKLEALNQELSQRSFLIEGQYITIKNKLFGQSSEKSANRSTSNKVNSQDKKKKVQLTSQRYPNLSLIERDVVLDNLPDCACCGAKMSDSGMTEDSEYLTVIPAQYYVVRQKRHKYRCGTCHGDIKTAPGMPRIKEGSSYSDEMMIDVSLAKYCDLIPMERYTAIAERLGVKDLPPQSLIESSHYLSSFVCGAYDKLKEEILKSSVLHADETPHRMLEGSEKKNWYLWGFSTPWTSYLEYHDTRSGDVASGLLSTASCRFLVSDVFSGYNKSVNDTNKIRAEKMQELVYHAYCNAHARRKFKEAADVFEVLADEAETPESKVNFLLEYKNAMYFVNQYRKIYRLEGLAKKFPDKQQAIRLRLRKYFEKIRDKSMLDVKGYSSKHKSGLAMRYFLKSYDGFTRFIDHPDVPIDNNPAERALRSPVIGRKTWYGTHSERGAKTAAILFSLVESCKLNKVNPREYFKNLVQDLHHGKPTYTPKEFADLAKN